MIFIPLVVGSKSPVAGPWSETASADPTVIDGWRARKLNTGLLTGAATNRIVVRDYDGPVGMALAREDYRRPRTRGFFRCLVTTPGGGLHMYLRSPAFPVPNAVKIGKQPIDLRSDGGYAVAVGSQIRSRRYEYLVGYELRSVDELPEFPEFWLPPNKEVHVTAIEEVDSLRRIARARAWLLKAEPAVSGQAGHNRMFFACCRMFQMFQLTVDQAYALILEYNERAVPPFSTKELLHKLESAASQKMKEA